jgi:two-component system, sensor histidine kinase YesM
MFPNLPVRTLKQRFFEIILAQFVMHCILFFILGYAVLGIYNTHITAESADKLALYMADVERNLQEVEQFAFSILGSYPMQNDMRTCLEYPGTYEAYEASVSLSAQLFTTTMNRSAISDTYFIFPDGKTITATNGYAPKPSQQFLEKVKAAAITANGSDVWMIDPEHPAIIVFGKVIHSIYSSTQFKTCGTLIFNINSTKILYYPVADKGGYDSRLLCYVNGILYDNDIPVYLKQKAYGLLNNTKDEGQIKTTRGKILFRKVNSDIPGWTFIHIQDIHLLLQKITQTQIEYGICFMLISLFVFLTMLRLSGFICTPLADISKHMLSTKNGIFTQLPEKRKIKVTEIQDLTESYNTMSAKINHLINEVYQKQLDLTDVKYKMLQKQINPHFLYNTLDTIHWKAVASGDSTIADMTLALSSLLRSSIKKPDIISLQEEMELVQNYMVIQQIRFEKRLVFIMNQSPDLMQFRLPKITLQPLIENSIKHNLEKYDGVCKISVSAKQENGQLFISVEDNGTHADTGYINRIIRERPTSQNDSSGLYNINYRLETCFGEQYGLTAFPITGREGQQCGMNMQIRIPAVSEISDTKDKWIV